MTARGLLLSALIGVGIIGAPTLASGVCEQPEKIGVETRIGSGRDISIVWNGDGYGAVWIDGPTGYTEPTTLQFARLDRGGRRIGDRVVIGDERPWRAPSLVWNGSGYGLAWVDEFSEELFFVQLEPDGTPHDDPSTAQIAAEPESSLSPPHLIWNGTEYGVFWNGDDNRDLHLTRINPAGIVVGTVIVSERNVESVVWNGSEYSLLTSRQNEYQHRLLDADGTSVGGETLVAPDPPNSRTFGSRAACHAWTGNGYGAVLRNCFFDTPCVTLFAGLDLQGAPLRVVALEDETFGAAIAWTGSEYGVAWQFSEAIGTWFARLDAGGERIDGDLSVTLGAGWQFPPRLLWNGEEFAFTVEPGSFIDGGSVWFGRIGCNCTDIDDDGVSVCNGDCDDSDTAVLPDAPEINDGQDNQCPGEPGFGLIDETGWDSGFHCPNDRNKYSWTIQPGATGYEIARSTAPDFSADCWTATAANSFLIDPDLPVIDSVFYYLNRALAPNTGSWGGESSGSERTVTCP